MIKNGKPTLLLTMRVGTLGGISTGEDIYFRVAFKPVSILANNNTLLTTERSSDTGCVGRHILVLPRAVPVVECDMALV